MKKIMCIFLALLVMFGCTACGDASATPTELQEKNVTIYIPDTMVMSDPNSDESIVARYVFEEGWQDKDSFTLNVEMEKNTDAALTVSSAIYSEECIVSESDGTTRVETYYDENGRAVRQKIIYLQETAPYASIETAMTYDEFGRPLKEETVCYEHGKTEPSQTETKQYTYTETETGSEARDDNNGMVYMYTFDRNYHQVSTSILLDGAEMSRMEYGYDEAGNRISMITYYMGEIMAETQYTWKTAEVSEEFAARMPQFNRAN